MSETECLACGRIAVKKGFQPHYLTDIPPSSTSFPVRILDPIIASQLSNVRNVTASGLTRGDHIGNQDEPSPRCPFQRFLIAHLLIAAVALVPTHSDEQRTPIECVASPTTTIRWANPERQCHRRSLVLRWTFCVSKRKAYRRGRTWLNARQVLDQQKRIIKNIRDRASVLYSPFTGFGSPKFANSKLKAVALGTMKKSLRSQRVRFGRHTRNTAFLHRRTAVSRNNSAFQSHFFDEN